MGKNKENDSSRLSRIEPHFFILFGVGIVVLSVFFIGYIRNSGDNERTVYNVEYETATDFDNLQNQRRNKAESAKLGDSDPSVKMSNRVVEANAIALALLQYILHKKIVEEKDVPGLYELIAGFEKSDIVPPGITVIPTAPNSTVSRFFSSRGVYFIRYQPSPLVVEVLSSGKTAADGEVFVLRSPDNSALAVAQQNVLKSAYWATLYVAPMTNPNAVIPAAFSSPQIYRDAGWSLEPLRVSDLSGDKLNAIEKLLSEGN